MSFWDGGCGRRGKGDDGRGAERGEEVAEGAVVGTKVVAPGGDAVGFVDGDEARLLFCEHLGEVGNAHAFGGDEEELEGAVEVVAAGLTGLVAGEARVDAGDAEAGGGELGGLVVHEGDERADDEGGAAAGDGGELVAEGLSGSGGHDEEDVAAVGGGAADCFLVGSEGGEAEGLVEQGFRGSSACSVSHIVRANGCAAARAPYADGDHFVMGISPSGRGSRWSLRENLPCRPSGGPGRSRYTNHEVIATRAGCPAGRPCFLLSGREDGRGSTPELCTQPVVRLAELGLR